MSKSLQDFISIFKVLPFSRSDEVCLHPVEMTKCLPILSIFSISGLVSLSLLSQDLKSLSPLSQDLINPTQLRQHQLLSRATVGIMAQLGLRYQVSPEDISDLECISPGDVSDQDMIRAYSGEGYQDIAQDSAVRDVCLCVCQGSRPNQSKYGGIRLSVNLDVLF